MKSGTWARVGRWMLVPVVFAVSAFAVLIFLNLSSVLDELLVGLFDGSRVHISPEIALSFGSLLVIFVALSLWIVPTAFAVGFALRSSMRSRLLWSFAVSLFLTALYLWRFNAPGSGVTSKITAGTIAAILISASVLSRVRVRTISVLTLALVLSLGVLTVPYWIAAAHAPPEPPPAQKLWSVALQGNSWQGMNTSSEYNSRRQAVFVGDRLLASFDAGGAPSEGNQPMATYRLLSIDLKTGAILNSKEFTGKWAAIPLLYATNDGHALLQHGSLTQLNPDLTESGVSFRPSHGRVGEISPDGSTMAWETFPGTTLLDSHTLTPLPQHLKESVPTAVSKRGVLTDNIYWYGKYPKDHAFVTLTDDTGQHLIFHGDCGGRPAFLTDEKVILTGCAKIRIIDTHGNLLRETNELDGIAAFAGVSRNGTRFAIEYTDVRGDPPAPLYDHFVVYDSETAQPLAMIKVENLPEYYSWSALSADGHLFAAGSPYRLSLYQIP